MEETDAFGIVKVRNLWDETGDAFDGVFIHVPFKGRLLDPVLEAFIGEVDAKPVEGVGAAGRVLAPGNVEETNESGKVILAEPLMAVY